MEGLNNDVWCLSFLFSGKILENNDNKKKSKIILKFILKIKHTKFKFVIDQKKLIENKNVT
jgi:hypothetical protein